MYKKIVQVALMIVLVMILGACGSADGKGDQPASKKESKAFQGNLKKIEYDDLVEKLDNKESFFLVTLETTDDAFVESGLEKAFDKALGNNGIEAYYLGFETMDDVSDEVKEKHLERSHKLKEYTHDEIWEDDGADAWFPRTSTLVYSDKGKVMTAEHEQTMDDEMTNIYWEDIQGLVAENDPQYEEVAEDIVSFRIEKFKEWNMLD